MKFAAAVALLAFLILPTSAFGADKVAPKISKAVMQDRDHDGRADAVLVTFSEKIRHSKDTKKPFPFKVAGYTVKSVGAAKGKTVLVKLVEKALPDGAAHPKVTYKRTKSKPVRDRAGNQAKPGGFKGTKPFDAVPPDTAITGGPSGTVTSRDATLAFSSEANATFECKLDAASFTPCTGGQAYAALIDGAHAFQVRAVDRAGNRDPTPAERAWSVDGDGDGSLAPEDCGADDAAIHPGAADSPDTGFVDDNCDGIDGDKAQAVFVAIAGTDVGGTCGAFEAPCRTINFAQSRAVTLGKPHVYISAGAYTGGASLQNGLELYGGYAADWSRTDSHPVTISGGFDSATNQYLTVKAISVTAELRDLRIVAPTASGTVDRTGRSSYGLVAQNSTLELERMEIVGGNGANGLTGVTGTSATQTAAQSGGVGGTGGEFDTVCDVTTRGTAGSAGVNVAAGAPSGGGAGGLGGTMDTNCGPFGACSVMGNCSPRPGLVGDNAATFTAGVFGSGGGPGLGNAGGCGSGANQGGGTGLPGLVANGAAGTPGSGSALSSSFWVPASGGAGGLGQHGTGGGGGGGGGGCDDGTDAYGAGGGGGGAGGLRATAAGGGGGGGGGSFAVFAVSSTVVITSSTLERGTAGDGGAGGQGGAGQPGGPGGPGGPHPGSDAAGSGGAGAHGGHSGGGGGGQGGHSYGVYSFLSTITRTGVTTLSGQAGTGGTGGAAGGSGGATGATGANGTLGANGTCVSAGAC